MHGANKLHDCACKCINTLLFRSSYHENGVKNTTFNGISYTLHRKNKQEDANHKHDAHEIDAHSEEKKCASTDTHPSYWLLCAYGEKLHKIRCVPRYDYVLNSENLCQTLESVIRWKVKIVTFSRTGRLLLLPFTGYIISRAYTYTNMHLHHDNIATDSLFFFSRFECVCKCNLIFILQCTQCTREPLNWLGWPKCITITCSYTDTAHSQKARGIAAEQQQKIKASGVQAVCKRKLITPIPVQIKCIRC